MVDCDDKNKRLIILIVIGAVIALIIGLLANSFNKLNSDEVGIKYNKVTKSLDDEPSYEGLHSGPPGFTFIKFPSVFRTLTYGYVQCLNKDGVEINLDVSYQYRIRGNEVYRIVSEFKDHDTFNGILQNLGKSAMLDSCSKFNTSQFQSDRGAFQEHLRTRLVNKYDQVFVDVTDLQVNDIVRPSRYETAVREKETAREDITVAENERPRRLTEAETQLLQAETTAAITIDRASSNARITENQATADAAAILNRYETEAASYTYLTDSNGLNLDAEGFLAYMGVRAIEDASSTVQIAMEGPAKTAYLNN